MAIANCGQLAIITPAMSLNTAAPDMSLFAITGIVSQNTKQKGN
jgi:hypothetical protein